jgi:hypothetical protein
VCITDSPINEERNLSTLKPIPNTRRALVVRTNFSDDAAWETICAAIQKPVGEFRASMDFLSDLQYDGVTTDQILSQIPENYNHSFISIADQIALSHPENAILVVDLYDEPGRAFRVIPSAMCGVENNLSIANMDFSEFADAVDPDGVFRDFPRH